MSLFDSPINKLKMNLGLTPDMLRALDRTTGFANQLSASANNIQPGGPVKGPSLFDRVGGAMMPTPQGLADAGLLSDDDLKQARQNGFLSLGAGLLANSGPKTADKYVSPMAALGQGIQAMQQGYQGAVGNAAQQRMLALQFGGMKEDLQRRGEIRTARQNIIKQYPMPKVGEPGAMSQWIDTVLPHFIEANDEETVARLSEIRKSLDNNRNQQVRAPQEIRLGDKVILRDPVTGQQVGEYPIAPSPRDPNSPDTAAELRMNRRMSREEMLTDDFNKDTKTQREAVTKMQGAIGEKDRAMQGDGSSQINILYAFVNAMDPASAVREGEIGLARAAAPFWTQAQALLNKYISDGSVTVPPKLVAQMTSLMERRVQGYNKYIGERSDYYTKRGKRWGIDTEGLFPGISAQAGLPKAAQMPAGWHAPMALPNDPRAALFPQR